MTTSRRKFIQTGLVAGAGILTSKSFSKNLLKTKTNTANNFPIVISTWEHGLTAGKKSIELLKNNHSLLDAVEKGINLIENDPTNTSVGIGGIPDADGIVTLDALIMDSKGNAGAVAFLENIKNPISVARLVMEKTQHVLLAGDGAYKFAKEYGFKDENLLTEEMKVAWEKWKEGNRKTVDPVEVNHDTIGLIALDQNRNIAGGVSTSGWGYKLHGRVGDSPIIGASLFVDNQVGAACATGHGEFAMKTLGSFLIVEKMREGFSPFEACKFAIERLEKKAININDFQLAYIAINKDGEHSGYSYRNDFEYAVVTEKGAELLKTQHLK